MSTVRIIGRSSSHFTRVAQIFAHELSVPFALCPIYDMTRTDTAAYEGNPALKLPSLERDGSLVFGAQNIARALAEMAPRAPRIAWPEEATSDLGRNAHELVLHAMAAQVDLIFGTMIGKLPADNIYFAKKREGFLGALSWLDGNLDRALADLPSPRDLSFFEVALFCLIDHLSFRQTVPVAPYASLTRFAQAFSKRPSAERTPYRFDDPPAA